MTEMWEPDKNHQQHTTSKATTEAQTPLDDKAQQAVQRARLAARGSYFGLIGLFTGDAVLMLFQGAPILVAIVLWLFRILPLGIFWPGIRKNNPRAYAWLSFAILLYFIHAVQLLLASNNLIYSALYCTLCVAIFTSAVVYIRVARKYLGQNLMS